MGLVQGLQNNFLLDVKKDRDELLTFAFDQIVLEEEMESVLADLERSVDADSAEQIYREAMFKYLALKDSGKLSDYEYDLHFSPAKNPPTRKQRFGSILVIVGITILTLTIVYLAIYGFDYRLVPAFLIAKGFFVTGFFMWIFGGDANRVKAGKFIKDALPF